MVIEQGERHDSVLCRDVHRLKGHEQEESGTLYSLSGNYTICLPIPDLSGLVRPTLLLDSPRFRDINLCANDSGIPLMAGVRGVITTEILNTYNKNTEINLLSSLVNQVQNIVFFLPALVIIYWLNTRRSGSFRRSKAC